VIIIDDNANGDLSDDQVRRFQKVGDAWEYQLTMQVPPTFGDEPVPAPARLRFTKDGLKIQEALVRRGTLPLPKAPMQFALLGSMGQFGLDHHFIAFDLNRDGKLDVETLDNPELFHVFEKTITIDDASYAFELVPDGSRLGLRPLKEKLAPRPPLSSGTPAPDFTVTDLDGKQVSLASLRGKVVLIDFWATSCGPCVRALPRLAELHAKYKAKGFELLAVAEPSDDVREVLGSNRAGISAIDQPAQALYRVDRYPMQFLVGRDGTILCSRCQLAKVEQLLAEQLP
jgi:thiol-disulfide isomerase/thioredoxin